MVNALILSLDWLFPEIFLVWLPDTMCHQVSHEELSKTKLCHMRIQRRLTITGESFSASGYHFHQGGCVFGAGFVFDYQQDYKETSGPIFMKLGGRL